MKVPKPGDVPPPTFKNFVTELASSALVCLGYINHPILKAKSVDLPRASHMIDLLDMIETKTHGNLNEEEQMYLETVLSDLRTKLDFVRDETALKAKNPAKKEPGGNGSAG